MRRILVALLLTGSTIAVSPPTSAAQTNGALSPGGARLSARLTAVDHQIRDGFRALGRARAAGEAPPPDLAARAAAAVDELAALDALARTLGEPEAATLAAKASSLRPFAAALARIGSAPPEENAAMTFPALPDRARVLSSAGPAPVNDAVAGATRIGYETALGTTAGATADGLPGCATASPDVWFRFTAPADGLVVASTAGSSFDTVLSVHPAPPAEPGETIACSDDAVGLQSAVAFRATAGQTYLIRVGGSLGAYGTYALTVGAGVVVRGTVRDRTTATPLAGTRVVLFGEDGTALVTAVTGADGSYTLASRPTGTIYVGTSDPEDGHVDAMYGGRACPGGPGTGCVPQDGRPLLAGVAGTEIVADIALAAGAQLSGNITDASSGEPVSSPWAATVRIWNAQEIQVASSSAPDGTWHVSELPAGTYRAGCFASTHQPELFDDIPCPSGECDPSAGTAIVVTAGQSISGIDFTPVRRGSISGTITDGVTGEPLAAAKVTARDQLGFVKTTTDSNGSYEFGGLSDGDYTVVASAGCHREMIYPGAACVNGDLYGCPSDQATPVHVETEVDNTGIDIALPPLGSISGRVTDSLSGAPLPATTVEVVPPGYSGGSTSTTDAGGRYRIGCLGLPEYAVTAAEASHLAEVYDDHPCRVPGHCNTLDATYVPVSDATDTEGIDFALDPGSAIVGRVTEDGSGAALPGIEVRVTDLDGHLAADVLSDESGDYRAEGLAPGGYWVVADGRPLLRSQAYPGIDCSNDCDPRFGDLVRVPAAVDVTGIDFDLQRLGGLHATVADAATAAPVTDAMFDLWTEDGNELYPRPQATRDGDGYLLQGLEPGSYYVATSSGGYIPQLFDGFDCDPYASCPPLAGTPVRVDLGEIAGPVRFSLHTHGGISGTIRYEGTSESPSYFNIEVWDDRSLVAFGHGSSAPGPGQWKVDDLPEGTYYVKLEPYWGYAGEVYPNLDCVAGSACDPHAGAPVTVTNGIVTDGIALTPQRTGALSGVVLDQDTGEPLSSVRIHVYDESGQLVGSAFTSGGLFIVTELPPGRYIARTASTSFSNEVFREVPCPSGGGCDLSLGEPIEVESGATTRHVDFTLRHLSTLSGRVSDAATGAPVSAVMRLIPTAGGDTLRTDASPDTGMFTFAAVPPGTYYLGAESSWDSVYFSGLYPDVVCTATSLSPCLGGAVPIVVGDSGDATGYDLRLERAGEISGHVTAAATGEPLDDASVTAYDLATGKLVAGTSWGTPSYHFKKLRYGSYAVCFSATTGDAGWRNEAYDDVPWTGDSCPLTEATPVVLSAAAPVAVEVNAALERLGTIRGTVTDAAGVPVEATVRLFHEDGTLAATSWLSSSYQFSSVAPGTYYVVADLDGIATELYDGVPCSAPEACELALGRPLEVVLDTVLTGIDFSLGVTRSAVQVYVRDQRTGHGIDGAWVFAYDATGQRVSQCVVEADTCALPLYSGTYFVKVTTSSFGDQLYDGIDCSAGCEVTTGTPVVVDGPVDPLEFSLESNIRMVRGRVRAAGRPLAGVIVDIWYGDTVALQGSAVSDENGYYAHSAFSGGPFYLSTDNGMGLVDQVYDGVPCPDGPAYEGLCDLTTGTAVMVADGPVDNLDFDLAGPVTIFTDGFEQGLGGWSLAVGD